MSPVWGDSSPNAPAKKHSAEAACSGQFQTPNWPYDPPSPARLSSLTRYSPLPAVSLK